MTTKQLPGAFAPDGSNYVTLTDGAGNLGSAISAAGTLTGTTLASNVVNSSLTSLGVLNSLSLVDTTSGALGIVRVGTPVFLHTYPGGSAFNIFLGSSSGNFTLTGTLNIGIGNSSLAANTSGAGNIGIGPYALLNSTTASNNLAIGYIAGANLTSGGGNVFIGSTAGGGITTGTNNTVIGAISGLAAGLTGAIILATGDSVIHADYNSTAASVWTFASPIVLKNYTVATLPTGVQGALAYVTDQLTTAAAKGVAPTGGGSVKCVVFYNGSAWVGV